AGARAGHPRRPAADPAHPPHAGQPAGTAPHRSRIRTSGPLQCRSAHHTPPSRGADPMAEHPAYPVGLRLSGRRVVVLGGGQVAQRRLPSLIAAGADTLLVSPAGTPSAAAMADAGEITWERRGYADRKSGV